MKHLPQKSEREQKALEALITATLHQNKTEVDPVIIAKYMKGDFTLTGEERASVEKIGEVLLSSFVKVESSGPMQADCMESEAFAALHRQSSKEGYSQGTKEELERKRRELREKLRLKIEKDKK